MIRISACCHKCGKAEEWNAIRKAWLAPYYVRHENGGWEQTQLCPSCAKWEIRYLLKDRRIGICGRIFETMNWSRCGRCRTSWEFVRSHATWHEAGSGMCPLCEACWRELDPEERLPFYRELWEIWMRDPHDETPTWPAIVKAVMGERAA